MSLDRFRSEPPELRSIRRRRLLITTGAVLALLLVAFAAWIGYYWYQSQNRLTVGGVERLLADSGPRTGSSEGNVKEWLDAHGFPAFHEEGPDLDAAKGVAEASGIPSEAVHDVWTTILSRAFGHPVDQGYIEVYFFFGRDRRLIGTVVKGG
jgi:hypothetical protein